MVLCGGILYWAVVVSPRHAAQESVLREAQACEVKQARRANLHTQKHEEAQKKADASSSQDATLMYLIVDTELSMRCQIQECFAESNLKHGCSHEADARQRILLGKVNRLFRQLRETL